MSSVIDTAERTVTNTRASLIDLGAQALKLVNDIRAAETRGVTSLLGRVGLQRRESSLRPLVWFAAGAITAGAVVYILAPTSGKKVRDRLIKLFQDRTEKPSAKSAAPPAPAPTPTPTPEAAAPPPNGSKQTTAH